MFHVTPSYPRLLARWLPPLVATALAASSLLAAGGVTRGAVALMAVAVLAFSLFAVTTLWLQLRRQRKRADATLLHWRAAMAAMVLAALCWALSGPEILIGVLLLLGTGVGVATGMLLKIVPFLSWFHLQHWQLASGRLDVRVPHMLSFLPERPARLQLAGHLVALVATLAAVAVPALSPLAGAALALSAAALGGLILTGAVRYRRIAAALRAD
jgi:hypothetical protein